MTSRHGSTCYIVLFNFSGDCYIRDYDSGCRSSGWLEEMIEWESHHGSAGDYRQAWVPQLHNRQHPDRGDHSSHWLWLRGSHSVCLWTAHDVHDVHLPTNRVPHPWIQIRDGRDGLPARPGGNEEGGSQEAEQRPLNARLIFQQNRRRTGLKPTEEQFHQVCQISDEDEFSQIICFNFHGSSTTHVTVWWIFTNCRWYHGWWYHVFIVHRTSGPDKSGRIYNRGEDTYLCVI